MPDAFSPPRAAKRFAVLVAAFRLGIAISMILPS